MRSLRRILVVIEPRQLRQPALQRALSLLKVVDGLRLEAVMPVYSFSWDLTELVGDNPASERRTAVMARHEQWLQAFLGIVAPGIAIPSHVVWSGEVGRDITDLAAEIGADLIVKSHDVHGGLSDLVYPPLDTQLMRHAPLPVLITRDEAPYPPAGRIVVALNFAPAGGPRQIFSHLRLLREAQELAAFCHYEIHLVSAIAPAIAPAHPDVPGFPAELIEDRALRDGCQAVREFAARHRIPVACCHVQEGQADEVIPALCRELKARVLFIGTSARVGLAEALIGNICERIGESLDCDIAVVTPKAVIRRLPLSGQTREGLK